ncbi:MAG: bifunctional hydroxymethylpyrimidine kinase/phosphomethylpyrimidine kinase [Candidatus Aminicenantes bacterium]|jgi:hydroxymethylpyrimidine/phosphomethylpyrimidine kinase
MRKVLLTIAGYDPTSGAGAVLDINVFQHLGFAGMGILTSLTAQNTRQVQKVICPPQDSLWNQYQTLEEDVFISGIKVGMVGCATNIPQIGRILSLHTRIPRIVDPVFLSSSGTWLLKKQAIPDYLKAVSGQTDLITPNAREAALVTGLRVKSLEDMQTAAEQIHHLTQIPCLVKGGHLEKETADVLYDGESLHIFKNRRLDVRVHGTGCFLSSSLLAFLCKGEALKTACQKAIDLTHKKMRQSVKVGHGQQLFAFFDPSQH